MIKDVEILPVNQTEASANSRVGLTRSASPFRYPGGKTFLCDFLENRLAGIPTENAEYAEPFCGGAGAAVLLLKRGAVRRIHLNDADIRIYSAWRAIVCETERFIERIENITVDIKTWYSFSDLVNQTSASDYDFELGFATFFLNRTSRSGIVLGSGPIGGYDQTGRWLIDARFNRKTLSERVDWLGSKRDYINLTNEDALFFLHSSIDRIDSEHTLFFIDPPYVTAGGRLYLNAMNPHKHIALSDIIQSNALPHWVVTYDDHPLIRSAYSGQFIDKLTVNYSLQGRRKESEILILPADHATAAVV